MKICSCCQQEKELTAENFGRRPRALDGFNGICRTCVRNRQNARYDLLRTKISFDVKTRRARLPGDEAEKARKRSRDWYRSNIERAKKSTRERSTTIRAEMIRAYGGRCACCGESNPLFLTIDHIDNDGAEHRRKLGVGRQSGSAVMMDLYKRKWPQEGFRLLCFNCNCGRQRNGGICPHEMALGAFACVEVPTAVAPTPPFDMLEIAA
jgi:hypothetical protein